MSPTDTLPARLWQYQKERFPLMRTLPLLAVFSAASINVSALLAGRALPGWEAYLTGLVLGLVIFFQMRVADEWKDADLDAAYRPERPIPRGLISLRLLFDIALALSTTAVVFAFAKGWPVLWLLLLVWVWLGLMTFEFGVPDWLNARPILYMVSHMAIMPLIDLLLTGVEWAGQGGAAPALSLFLILSFLNGCILEVGRKIWAPESEREGVQTYSGLWGIPKSTAIWVGTVWVAAFVLILLGIALGVPVAMALVAILGAGACTWVALRMRATSDPTNEKLVDNAAGLWVLVCYGAAGFLPLLLGGAP